MTAPAKAAPICIPSKGISADEVRTYVLEQARLCEDQPWRSTGIAKWCKKHGVSKPHTSEFLSGKRVLPTSDILDALGLEWRIERKAGQ